MKYAGISGPVPFKPRQGPKGVDKSRGFHVDRFGAWEKPRFWAEKLSQYGKPGCPNRPRLRPPVASSIPARGNDKQTWANEWFQFICIFFPVGANLPGRRPAPPSVEKAGSARGRQSGLAMIPQ